MKEYSAGIYFEVPDRDNETPETITDALHDLFVAWGWTPHVVSIKCHDSSTTDS